MDRRQHSKAADRGLNDKFHFDMNGVLQRKMRRCRMQEWHHTAAAGARQAHRGFHRMPRHDYLTDFGTHHVAMVDELSRCVVSASDKSLIECFATSVSETPLSSLTTSCSAVHSNPPSTHFDLQAPLCLSEGSLARASVIDLGGRSSRSFPQGMSSCSATSSCSKARRFQSYSLHPCNCGHAHRAKLVLFAAQADILLSCSTKDRHMTAYHIALGVEVGRLVGHDDLILGGAVSPDDTLVATTSCDCTAILWDLPSCKQRRSLTHPQFVHACRFSSSGTELATACADGLCRIWTWSASAIVNILVPSDTGFNGALSSLAYSLGDKVLLAGGSARNVYVWDCESFSAPAAVFRQHRSAVLSVDASRAHQDIVMTAEEATLLVWNCATLEVLQRIDVSFCDAQSPWRRGGALTASEMSVKRTTFPHELYWTAARLMDSRFGLVLVAATSDKRLYLFDFVATYKRRSADDIQTQLTGTAAQVQPSALSEMLSLSLRSPVSSMDSGPPNRVVFGDSCGNRYILELN
ncbi:WD domain, G-beta repeat family protein [Leishmania donovani]|uniref:WD domain, G-beta repeat family protein n=2 Tax=Leishmania donovani TaxID=5661 RepID=A0A504X5K1_LEIDO|nr:WD domain, G-beta repeat family protein [Leishmania donovani]